MNKFCSNSDQTSISLISASLNHSKYRCQWNTSTLGTIKLNCTRREYPIWFFSNFDHLCFWTLVYDLENRREINRSCLISACHFYEQSRIIKWNYLVSIKLRSFFVACCRKWVPEEKRPLLHWLMYWVFQCVCWKSCIFLFNFTHILQEVHCSNEHHSTTLMLSSQCQQKFVFHSVHSCV